MFLSFPLKKINIEAETSTFILEPESTALPCLILSAFPFLRVAFFLNEKQQGISLPFFLLAQRAYFDMIFHFMQIPYRARPERTFYSFKII